MPELIYEADTSRYTIDGCLPQRSAIAQGEIGFHGISHGHYPGTIIADDVLPGISSMGFMDAIGEQSWGMANHRNEGIEICLQETGASDLHVDEVHFPMPAKTLSITRPWQLHRMGNPNLGTGRLHWVIVDVGVRRPNQDWQWPDWCILTDSDLRKLTSALRGSEHPVWNASSEIVKVLPKPRCSHRCGHPLRVCLAHHGGAQSAIAYTQGPVGGPAHRGRRASDIAASYRRTVSPRTSPNSRHARDSLDA